MYDNVNNQSVVVNESSPCGTFLLALIDALCTVHNTLFISSSVLLEHSDLSDFGTCCNLAISLRGDLCPTFASQSGEIL